MMPTQIYSVKNLPESGHTTSKSKDGRIVNITSTRIGIMDKEHELELLQAAQKEADRQNALT